MSGRSGRSTNLAVFGRHDIWPRSRAGETRDRAQRRPGYGEPGLVGVHHQLCAIATVELGQQLADVGLHGAVAHVQLVGDLLVGQPAGDLDQHLPLAVGEPVVIAGRGRAGEGGELLDQAPGDRGSEQRVPGRHHGDGLEQLGGPGVLEQEAAGACAQRVVHQLVLVEGGQDQDPCVDGAGRVVDDPPGRLHAVHAGHPDVHQHHVGRRTAAEVQGLATVAGLADDLDLRRGAEQHDEPGAHQLLVVDDRYPDHDRSSARAGRCARTRKPVPSRP